MNRKHAITLGAAAVAALVAAGCSTGPSPTEVDQQAQRVINSAFKAQGIAKLDRLVQDPANDACSDALGEPLAEAQAKAIQAAALKTVPVPTGGAYLGDWKEGEKIAQSGRGMTWKDKAGSVNGGNCYNCHQISKQEISFGTIGPSLYQYGKLRGVSDPTNAASRTVVEYTWGKLWNPRATNACSQMPRFGHKAILDETQMRHLMALLLDPKSPVNAQ